jgi:hypothetical protein
MQIEIILEQVIGVTPFVQVLSQEGMRWACMGEIRSAYSILFRKPEGKEHLGTQGQS